MIRATRAKLFLVASGRTNRWLSKETGICESVISRILTGRYIPTEAEKEKIATALKKPVSEVF